MNRPLATLASVLLLPKEKQDELLAPCSPERHTCKRFPYDRCSLGPLPGVEWSWEAE